VKLGIEIGVDAPLTDFSSVTGSQRVLVALNAIRGGHQEDVGGQKGKMESIAPDAKLVYINLGDNESAAQCLISRLHGVLSLCISS
jgi:hypothetical protein